MNYRKLAVRLSKERAELFESRMRGRGHPSAAAALRALIDAAIAGEGIESRPAPALMQQRPSAQGRTRRLWVHVREGEAAEIRALAAPFGGLAAWFRGLLDARMGRATELPAREEIQALHLATVQLGKLATNINQIARALNTARLAGEPLPNSALRLDELEALRSSVNDVSSRATAVVLAARRRVFNE